jgi:uncharacterized membrane protein YgdD (TMEM256/DUF423 family)
LNLLEYKSISKTTITAEETLFSPRYSKQVQEIGDCYQKIQLNHTLSILIIGLLINQFRKCLEAAFIFFAAVTFSELY